MARGSVLAKCTVPLKLGSTLLLLSSACTVTLNDWPTPTLAGPVSAKRWPAVMTMPICWPVMLGVRVSVAVSAWVPGVKNTTGALLVPASAAAKRKLAGNAASGSELVSATMPRYPVARLL